jgi:nucleoside-diphosphate-sugar epimerase
LIHTSSPSVVFAGEDQNGVDETVSYPREFLAAYPQTKAVAERLVLSANSPDLATVALRPHLIWGPGDRHLIPRVLDRARRGRLRLIGDGSPLVDAVYIDNAVEAHLCAMERLAFGSPIAGKVYFVTNQEPWPLGRILNRILEAGALPPLKKKIGLRTAWFLGRGFEWIYTFFRIRAEPPLTRFVVAQLGTAHWYDAKAAREELGYVPKVSMEEGFRRLSRSLATAPKPR